MAKKKIDTRGGKEGLKHNPFAALLPEEAASAQARTKAPNAESPDEAREAAVGRPFASKVVVRREKKGRGGKTVTRISGIEAAHREALAGRMKKALGCGALVEGEDVVLLGSLVDRAAAWLEEAGATNVVRSS